MKKLDKSLSGADFSAQVKYFEPKKFPDKVLQIGEGNFLRAFIDWMIHQMNKQGLFNGSIVAVQPTPHGKVLPKLINQDCLYTVVLKGVQNGRVVNDSEIISVISRGINPYEEWEKVIEVAESKDLEFIFSNTTEAGITYLRESYTKNKAPLSYPGKLTALLFHRFEKFSGNSDAGLIIIPCELIEDNGQKLKNLVLEYANDWDLPAEFSKWVKKCNTFCDTLVDRIVTGYPRDSIVEFHSQLGYEDRMLTVGEPYHMFAIDADEQVKEKLPFDQAGLNIKWEGIQQHREMKVRLLNGPHTLMAATGFLYGADTVLEVMEDQVLGKFVEKGFEEIIPTVPMSMEEKKEFSESVKERFLNPYNKHYLTDIAMNSINKFKSRLLPSLKRYVEQKGEIPQAIALSFAALLVYYKPVRRERKGLIGRRNEIEYTMRENELVVEELVRQWELHGTGKTTIFEFVQSLFENESIWDENLNEISNLNETIAAYMEQILREGMQTTVEGMLRNKAPLG